MKGILGWFVVGYLYYLVISGKVVQFVQIASQPSAAPATSTTSTSSKGKSGGSSILSSLKI